MRLEVDIRKAWRGFSLDVSFATEDGVTGLLGASGSGKSMTLKCIAGIETPDAGRIALDGRVLFDRALGVNLPPQQRGVGYLFQSYALFSHMNVENNLRCAMADKSDWQALEKMVQLLEIGGLERRLPHQLSGGQAQRVALGRMLLSQPQLLLLDEPFSALDSHLREEMQVKLREILRQVNRQALLVTHSREEAYRLCSRLCVLEGGRVIQTGAKEALFQRPETVGAARLLGYRNIISAQKRGENQVYLPGWNATFTTAAPVPADVSAIAIPQAAFRETGAENPIFVEKQEEMDAPNHPIVLLWCRGMTLEDAPLWWRIPGAQVPAVDTVWVPAESILLLRA